MLITKFLYTDMLAKKISKLISLI